MALGGWLRERLYPYRWLLLAVGLFAFNLIVPLSYNRSFKLVTALGLLTLPLACWVLAKAADLPFPTPPLFAAAGVLFIFNREPVFNNTGNIIGGNFQSTMAGEFAFSISLTLAVLYLAVAVRGLRTGKHRALAAVLFALAGLCHLIPAFFVLGCTAALFLVHPDRKRFRWLVDHGPGRRAAHRLLGACRSRCAATTSTTWAGSGCPSALGRRHQRLATTCYPDALRYLFLARRSSAWRCRWCAATASGWCSAWPGSAWRWRSGTCRRPGCGTPGCCRSCTCRCRCSPPSASAS